MTSKLQVTLPKALARRYGIEPGDEIDWVAADDVIRVVPAKARGDVDVGVEERLRLFDRATERQARRQQMAGRGRPGTERGWTREELYRRGSAD